MTFCTADSLIAFSWLRNWKMKTRRVREMTTVWTTEVSIIRSVLSTKGEASGSDAPPLIKT